MDLNGVSDEVGRVCIIILRDVNSAAAGRYAHLIVDAMPKGVIRPGEKVQLFIDSGIHSVGVAPLGVSNTDLSHSITLEMHAETTCHFRIYLDSQSNKLLVELCP